MPRANATDTKVEISIATYVRIMTAARSIQLLLTSFSAKYSASAAGIRAKSAIATTV